MKGENAFVSLDPGFDNDEVVVIDMDQDYSAGFVTIDEGYENMDFITLADDVEFVSEVDIVDIDAFEGMDDVDLSFIV